MSGDIRASALLTGMAVDGALFKNADETKTSRISKRVFKGINCLVADSDFPLPNL